MNRKRRKIACASRCLTASPWTDQHIWQHAQTVLSERQIKALNRLLDAGPEGFEGGLNARKHMSLTNVSKATVTRDLTELVEKGCLVQRPGGGRSTSYDINWP